MNRPMSRRPSAALLVAIAALLVAVGGSAFGAIAAIPSNNTFTACYQTSDNLLDRMREELDVARLSTSEAKRLVAGGVRFARQNGFKLPPHYERWTAIFGDLGDLAAVDLTDFGVEGGLRYVGTKAFLQRRLAACTVDEFLNRPDVQWVLGESGAI